MQVEKQITESRPYATMKPDDKRELWLGILHGITLIRVAIVKYLRLENRCDKCGDKL